jgi:hypothetical protein
MTVATAPMPTSTFDDRRSFDGPRVDDRRRARTARRGFPRVRTLKGAAIVVPAGTSIRCTIKNVSQTGACLQLQAAVFLSHTFTIVFDDPDWPRRRKRKAGRSRAPCRRC